VNPVIEEVTMRIIARSKESRMAYLARMSDAAHFASGREVPTLVPVSLVMFELV